jgi:hypothetical protein
MQPVELDARLLDAGGSCAERNTSQNRCGCIVVTFEDASGTNPMCCMTNVETAVVSPIRGCSAAEGTEPARGKIFKLIDQRDWRIVVDSMESVKRRKEVMDGKMILK